MAEKKATAAKAATTKTATKAAAKPAEKKTAAKPAEKKTTTKAATKKVAKVEVYVNAENAGFRAGDIYNTLSAEAKSMSVAEIAKAAGVSEADILLGAGWLLKEGKLATTEDNKLVLA